MRLSDVASALNGELVGDGSATVTRAVHPAEASSPCDLALAMGKHMLDSLESSEARFAVLSEDSELPARKLEGYIVVKRPRYAMAGLTDMFELPVHAPDGIHSAAVVEPDATIEEGVRIGPFTYVASGAVVGAGAVLMSNVTVGAGARIGEGSLLHAGARIGERVEIGARAIIHQNASIGADGFSFVTPQEGAAEEARGGMTDKITAQNTNLVRINSLGTVALGDDVEIGACTSIDRGTVSATRIGNNTKIDDLVMIGHNVIVGENCMICGQVGIAGSTVIGDRVVLAGLEAHAAARADVGPAPEPARTALSALGGFEVVGACGLTGIGHIVLLDRPVGVDLGVADDEMVHRLGFRLDAAARADR